MSYEEIIKAKNKFIKSMCEEEINEHEMVIYLKYFLHNHIINDKEFEEVKNNKKFNKNLIHILNKYNEEFKKIKHNNLFDLLRLNDDYDYHKNIFNFLSKNLTNGYKGFILDYITKNDFIFNYDKKELIGLYNDEILKSIDDKEIQICLYRLLIVNSYMRDDINNQIKYDDIELLVDDINRIGIHKIVDTFEDLFKNISRNITNEEFAKYLYFKNNLKNMNNLKLNIYDSNNSNNDYSNYFNNIKLYELIINDFVDKDKLAINKLESMYETVYSKVNYNIFNELYYEKVNYKLGRVNFYHLASFKDRASSLPNIYIENLNYVEDDIEDDVDELIERNNVEVMIQSLLHITNDNQDDIIKHMKEKYSDEISNYKKKLIEDNDLLTLELFDKKFDNELKLDLDKDIKTVKKRKMF